MAIYNLTNITASTSIGIGDTLYHVNIMSNYILAWAILIVIFAVALFGIMRFDYSIYTALPAASFITATTALLFRLIQVDGNGMVSTRIVVICWILTALFAGIRVMVEGNN
jgi:hypothetical protein